VAVLIGILEPADDRGIRAGELRQLLLREPSLRPDAVDVPHDFGVRELFLKCRTFFGVLADVAVVDMLDRLRFKSATVSHILDL
jgi:hypothetical protein